MKWISIVLGTLVGLIVVAVVVLLVLGARKGSNEMLSVVEIDRAPSAVWPWITQPERQKQWVSWLVEFDLLANNERVWAPVKCG